MPGLMTHINSHSIFFFYYFRSSYDARGGAVAEGIVLFTHYVKYKLIFSQFLIFIGDENENFKMISFWETLYKYFALV